MNKYFTEFIGTFFLVLVIALTGNPLAIGAALTALIYMGGYISGAQYNPAVTFALLMNEKIDASTALKYIGVQLLAGFSAAVTYYFISFKYFTPQPGINIQFYPALIVEILFTFILASVVLHTAATNKTKGNEYYGLAIGAVVAGIAFAGGPVSGGVYNPAVAVGPILFNFSAIASNLLSLLLYILGPLTGGILAGILYKSLGHNLK